MDIASIFEVIFGYKPTVTVRAPGRVNLLGEHVDYNEGVVLPAAIDRRVSLAAAPAASSLVTLHAHDLKRQVAFSLRELDQKIDSTGQPLPGWARYPAGVAWALQEAGYALTGMNAIYSSDIPIGAGLSSSAAVEVAFATTWQALSGWNVDKLALARLCQRAENEYVGVSSGLMDQFASVCGVEGHVLRFDTRNLDWESLRLPSGTAIVIADSGIRRSLTNSGYNDRRAACEQAVQLLQKYLPRITSLRDVSSVELAAYSTLLPPVVEMRAEHVVKEIHRVEQAIIALGRGDIQMFGGFMFASHKSLRDLYQVSLPELDCLVEIARGLPGIYGARLTGAGFGGCTVNLVDEINAPAFIQGLVEGYCKKMGRTASVYLCQASRGAEARWENS
ncbi:MAG: galactokinase [Anaerolineales bacterium]|nr:MAG: galactokinase [Anaerolineales bacterium]